MLMFVFGYLAALATVVLSVILGRVIGLGDEPDQALSPAWRDQHARDAERNNFHGVCWRWPVQKD